jgi:general secretion pathway protein G
MIAAAETTLRPSGRCEDGFSLIVVIVLVGALALTVAILPKDVFTAATYRGETELEMEWVAQALHDYYCDTRTFPPSLANLEAKPDGVAQWLGPYAVDRDDAQHSAVNDFSRDAWGRAYTFAVTGLGKGTLSSAGRDGAMGTADDVVVMVDSADVLRDLTIAEIDAVEAAILAWNADCLPDAPLPTDYSLLLDELQTWGYLPPGAAVKAELLVDAWGAQYVTGPAPVFDIDSTSW